MNIKEAFAILKNSSRVESRLINEGGEVSRVFHAYSILVKSKNSVELFANLSKESLTNAGKVYAAIWFFSHDMPSYLKAKASIMDDEAVEVRIADIVYRLSMKEVFYKIENENLAAHLEMKGLRE